MITCPNCGWQNPDGSRFCENCGADLKTLNRAATTPVSSWPEPPRPRPAQIDQDVDPSAPEWKMAPLPHEEPPKQRRRIWIWILVLALLACLAFCALSFGWLSYTDSGQHFQTRVSEEQTVQAGN